MKEIKIEKDGIWCYIYNQETSEYDKERPDHICSVLRCACEIDDGVTLHDIFDAVDMEPELKEFISQYSWCRHIDEFHADANKFVPESFVPESEEDPLKYLEIRWHVNTSSYKGKQSIDISSDFHGVGESGTSYSVSYSPMGKLAHLPVKLSTDFDIYASFAKGKKEKLLFHGEQWFSLLEVLDAIYDDISFNGGTDDNVRFLEEMQETTAKIKSGEIKCVPWEKLNLDEEEEEEEEEEIDPENN